MKPETIKRGMVFTFDSKDELKYVVLSLSQDDVTLERITHRDKTSNRHACGYGWFEYPSTKYIRTMDEKELSLYQTTDPVCNLEKGIYTSKTNINTLLEQPAIREDEVIRVLDVKWDDYKGCQGEQYKLNVIYQQFGKTGDNRLSFHTDEKMGCIRWFWDHFDKINVNQ